MRNVYKMRKNNFFNAMTAKNLMMGHLFLVYLFKTLHFFLLFNEKNWETLLYYKVQALTYSEG